ncbi:hypothetical protein F8M41_007805 [Gigaspora margarita]|uniref:Uncharacterized protein n=1 Tax=Gigaspora margarita TaxID=4874 RepID=A0A8H4B4E3_GIGMA|nr:hypothetical protein F8M41_007805 [Gigaspora margarita]
MNEIEFEIEVEAKIANKDLLKPCLFFKLLEKYTICEKYYNQIVAKDNYLNYLKGESLFYSRKRSSNFNTLNNIQMESLTTIDIGIQVEINNNNDLLMQIEALKNSCNTLVANHTKQVQIIEIKNNKIFELEHK